MRPNAAKDAPGGQLRPGAARCFTVRLCGRVARIESDSHKLWTGSAARSQHVVVSLPAPARGRDRPRGAGSMSRPVLSRGARCRGARRLLRSRASPPADRSPGRAAAPCAAARPRRRGPRPWGIELSLGTCPERPWHGLSRRRHMSLRTGRAPRRQPSARPRRRSSHKNSGAPSRLVSTPGGSSTRVTLRASVSTSTTRTAPSSAARGSRRR